MKKITWIEDLKANGNFKLSQYGLNHTIKWLSLQDKILVFL